MYKLITTLSLIGISLAIYLFYSYLAPIPPGLCNISASVNCDAVTKGPLAELMGIPVSLIGLIGYILILYGALMKFPKLILFMAGFGMIFCLRLTILEIFVEKVFCPVCGACQLIMFILFILGIILNRRTTSTLKA
jgi:uncharacterized membrane protein